MLYFARFIIIFLVSVVHNQILAQNYTQQDSIRGTLNKYRSCYDVKFYDLFIMLDDIERSIERSYNIMHVQANTNFDKIQIDLFDGNNYIPIFNKIGDQGDQWVEENVFLNTQKLAKRLMKWPYYIKRAGLIKMEGY